MKKMIVIMIALVFAFGVASLGLTAEKAAEKPMDKCSKCHKDDKALDKVVAKKGIKSSADFVKAASAAKVHGKLTDADYKAAAKELKLAE